MAVPGHPDRVDGQGTERDLDHPRPTPGDDARDSEAGSKTLDIGPQEDRPEQDGAPERDQEERHGWSRRALFGAGGGFALAASGLVLPKRFVEEADAADTHPVRSVQQRKERRRKKQRTTRDRRNGRRRHDHDEDKQHDRPGPPQLGPHGIKLTVENQTSSSFQIKFWYGSAGWFSQEGDLASQGTFFTGTDDLHAGIEFLTERHPFVWVENPVAGTPNTTYQYGGSMGFIGYTGGTVDVDHGTLEVGAETTHRIPFTNSSTFAIKVRRERDIPAFKVFTMTVLPA